MTELLTADISTSTAHRGPVIEVQHSIPSRVATASAFIDQLMSLVASVRVPDGSEVDVELALREALANAVIHGNHEDATKRVGVECRWCADGDVSITVRDEGAGFDVSEVPDPTAIEQRMSNHGRGIYMMRALMDDISFDQGGTVLHMHKKAYDRAIR